jgi:hypothetical protein
VSRCRSDGSSGVARARESAKKPEYPPDGDEQLVTVTVMELPAVPCEELSVMVGPPGVASVVAAVPVGAAEAPLGDGNAEEADAAADPDPIGAGDDDAPVTDGPPALPVAITEVAGAEITAEPLGAGVEAV